MDLIYCKGKTSESETDFLIQALLPSFFLIHMCIQCLGHFSPLPHTIPNPFSPQPPHPLDSWQKLFCPYL
jgi:hypothetical protein